MENLEDMLREKNEKIATINSEYAPSRFAETLISNLNSYYNTITEAEKNTKIPILRTAFSKLTDEEKMAILEGYDDKKKKKLEALDKPMEITTYITSDNGNGSCYILTPIKEEDKSSKFIGEFKDWFVSLMDKKCIQSEDETPVLFKPEEGGQVAQGFLIFKVTPYNCKNKDFTEAFVKRLNHIAEDSKHIKYKDIQPKFCRENNIINVAKPLDFEIFKYFMDYMPVQETETAKVVKKRRRLEHELVEPHKGKYRHFVISPAYTDPKKVIGIYNTLNDKFKEVNGEDMPLSNLTRLGKIGEKSGWTFYSSLIKHLENETIKPEEIHSSSNLVNYILKAQYITLSNQAIPLHLFTRTEMNNHHPVFYDKIKKAEEANGKKFDFIPYLRAPKGSKKES